MIPALIICLSLAKWVMFPSLVLIVAGFVLSCLNNHHKILPSRVISK